MGELIVALFIGLWLTLAGALTYIQLKRDYKKIERNIK